MKNFYDYEAFDWDLDGSNKACRYGEIRAWKSEKIKCFFFGSFGQSGFWYKKEKEWLFVEYLWTSVHFLFEIFEEDIELVVTEKYKFECRAKSI